MINLQEVRNIAKNFNLPIYDKNDSQDFYEGDYNELLNVDEKIGNVIAKDINYISKTFFDSNLLPFR